MEEAGARQETVTEEDGVASQRSREKEEEDREEKDNNVPKKDEEKLNDVNMKEDDKEEDGKESGTRVELQSTSSQPKSTYHPVRLPGSQPPPPPPPPPLPYTEPHWSGLPTQPFSLTVIKNGSVVEEIDISTKPFLVRHGMCTVRMYVYTCTCTLCGDNNCCCKNWGQVSIMLIIWRYMLAYFVLECTCA